VYTRVGANKHDDRNLFIHAGTNVYTATEVEKSPLESIHLREGTIYIRTSTSVYRVYLRAGTSVYTVYKVYTKCIQTIYIRTGTSVYRVYLRAGTSVYTVYKVYTKCIQTIYIRTGTSVYRVYLRAGTSVYTVYKVYTKCIQRVYTVTFYFARPDLKCHWDRGRGASNQNSV
jgi:hypothetical protein